MSVRDYADDVLAVMSGLGISRAPVVGISMGGTMALTMALSAPERVASLIVADSFARADSDMAAGMKAVASVAVTHGMQAAAEQVKPATFCAAAITEQRPYVWEFEEEFAATDPYAFSIAMDAIAELDVLEDLPHITVPTLVLIGAEDVLQLGEAGRLDPRTLHVALPLAHLRSQQGGQELEMAMSGGGRLLGQALGGGGHGRQLQPLGVPRSFLDGRSGAVPVAAGRRQRGERSGGFGVDSTFPFPREQGSRRGSIAPATSAADIAEAAGAR
jgi:pimeloyl-ACP methyl ester carboxylesterase